MRDTYTFRVWSGIYFLISILTNLFTASFQGLRLLPEGSILNLLFLNLIPGIASLILARPKKANNIALTIILGACLLENLAAISVGFLRFHSLLTSSQIPSWYPIVSRLLNISLPLLVCLIMNVHVLKDPGEPRNSSELEQNGGKKRAGICRIITGAFLIAAAAAGTVLLLLYSEFGTSDPQFAYIYLMDVFGVVLIASGIISVRAASGRAELIIPEMYSFFIIVIFFVKGMLQILLPWKAYGGGFLQGSGDVVIVSGVLTFLLICIFLWYFIHLIVLLAAYVQNRRLKRTE